MSCYVINGRFLAERTTGIQRYAYELTRALDDLVEGMGLEIYVPADAKADLSVYRNIRVVMGKRGASQRWEQLDFPRYLRKRGAKGVNLCNVVPLVRPQGIACIHDISYKVNPAFFKASLHARASRLWHCLNYAVITSRCETILTDSEFSKREILSHYRVDAKRIAVVPCAWQHIVRDAPDDTLFDERFPLLERGGYFYSMCSAAKNKNLEWVLEVAHANPDDTFVISGMYDPVRLGESFDLSDLGNVSHLGYVSDDEARLLMRHCKAFLFPTFYEGFGLPPLEALALGADCVVSDTPVMREVYGDAVSYVDPNVYELRWQPVGQVVKEALLARYSWHRSAALAMSAF